MKLLTTFVLVVGIAAVLVLSQNHPDCGTKGPKEDILGIINGSDSSPHEFPWQLLFLYYPDLSDKQRSSLCGASLLNEFWALTAAHCVLDNGIPNPAKHQFIIAGIHRIKEYEAGIVPRQIVESIPHPDYNKIRHDYDFALVKFNQSIDLSLPHIGTICLPNKQKLDDISGHTCVATGWGSTVKQHSPHPNILQKAYGQIWNQSECKKYTKINVPDVTITDRGLCWGQPNNFSACTGDSGGPLACKMPDDKWYEYGVASWVNGDDANICIYDHFARVSEVTEWIWNTINQHS